MSNPPRPIGWIAMLPLLFVATAGAEAQLTPTPPPPPPGHTDSRAPGINPRGARVGARRGGCFLEQTVVSRLHGPLTRAPRPPGGDRFIHDTWSTFGGHGLPPLNHRQLQKSRAKFCNLSGISYSCPPSSAIDWAA